MLSFNSYLNRFLIAFSFLLFLPFFGFSIDTQVDMSLNASLGKKKEAWDFNLIGNAYTRVILQNENQQLIKALFAIEANVSDKAAGFGIYQAYIRFRTNNGLFRFTMGKAPISWGEGIYYNAGDVLFSSTNPSMDFNRVIKTDNTRWVIVPYFSIGSNGFFEALISTPSLSYYDTFIYNYLDGIGFGGDLSYLNDPSWSNLNAGFRFSWKSLDVQWQTGVMYIGSDTLTRPFISMSGGIAQTVDWYLSSRVGLSPDGFNDGDWYKSWDISLGFYFPWVFRDSSNLSIRVEGLIRPLGNWYLQNGISSNEWEITREYLAAQAFLDITYILNSFFTFSFRDIYSIIDQSTVINVMFTLSPLQDLSLTFNTIIQVGGKDNTLFNLEKENSLLFSIILRYIWS